MRCPPAAVHPTLDAGEQEQDADAIAVVRLGDRGDQPEALVLAATEHGLDGLGVPGQRACRCAGADVLDGVPPPPPNVARTAACAGEAAVAALGQSAVQVPL